MDKIEQFKEKLNQKMSQDNFWVLPFILGSGLMLLIAFLGALFTFGLWGAFGVIFVVWLFSLLKVGDYI